MAVIVIRNVVATMSLECGSNCRIISEKHAHSFQKEGMSVLGTEDLQPNKQSKDVMETLIICFGREKRSDDDSTPAFKPDAYVDFIEKKVENGV